MTSSFCARLFAMKCQKSSFYGRLIEKKYQSRRLLKQYNKRHLFTCSQLCSDLDTEVKPESKSHGSTKRDKQVLDPLHVPVMKNEVIRIFAEAKCRVQTILDMTFGAGGHSKCLLDAIPDCSVIALDRDPQAYALAKQLAEQTPRVVTVLNGRFSDLPRLLSESNIQLGSINGVLMDLGSSSMQFDEPGRGFSLSKEGPLDMRMDGNRLPNQPNAADVVNSLDEVDLAKIIKKYGEDPRAKKIAHGIVQARSAFGRIKTTKQLASVIEDIFPGHYGMDKLGRYSHPATKVFQALRIFVNNELNELNTALEVAHQYLTIGGVCVAISFHSLEDRIVKRHFHDVHMDEEKSMSVKQKMRSQTSIYTLEELDSITQKKWEPLSRKVCVATEDEVSSNPRSRSAKVRAARKIK